MNPEQNAQPPQKLIDFNEELKALCDKYQYELRPVLQFDPVRGIFPTLQAMDVSPKDAGVLLTTTEVTPQEEPTIDSSVSADVTPEVASN